MRGQSGKVISAPMDEHMSDSPARVGVCPSYTVDRKGHGEWMRRLIYDVGSLKRNTVSDIIFTLLNKVENPHNGPSALLVLKSNWFPINNGPCK